MTDCLIIGFNDPDFAEYEKLIRAMGPKNGAYRDLTWGFVDYDNRPQRCLDLLTHFYYQDKPTPSRPFTNVDYMWVVVLYLANYLARWGFTFDYVNLFHFEKEKLRQKLLRGDVMTVAITTTLYVAPHPILEIVSFIRAYSKDVKIIIGGPYIAGQAKMLEWEALEDQFKYLGGDIYVIGSEGEAALVNVLRSLKERSSLDKVDNIAYREGAGFAVTQKTTEYNPLEENMVDYGLFPADELGQFITTRTAKSCPFSCSFCGFPERAGAYKYLSVELVEKEMNAIAEIGTVTTVSFIDDTFNVPKGRFKDMLRMMIRNKYEFKWNSYYRSDHGDDETIDLMAQAGCEGVLLGVESGSDRVLEAMNKSARRKDYLRAIPRLQSVGISAYASLIIGFPTETFETVEETVSLIEETRPDFFRPQLWYCDPITPIYRQKEKYGIRGQGFSWTHDTMDVDTACDLIERTFLSVENSTWLPEHGFEQWSTFYLQRQGMTMPQIKQYVKSYNAAVKERLICPNKKGVSPELIEVIKLTAQFDKDHAVDMGPVTALSGKRYLEAEKFWVDEFGGDPSGSSIKIGEDDAAATNWATSEETVSRAALEEAGAGCDAESTDILLAAYSILLSRLNSIEDTVIVTSRGGDEPSRSVFPLRLHPVWTLTFREFLQDIPQKQANAIKYQRYGFGILTNPLRMGYFGGKCPVFDAGCEIVEGPSHGLKAALKDFPEVYDGLKLILKVEKEVAQFKLQVASRFSRETTKEISSFLKSIISEVTENVEVRLIDIQTHKDELANSASIIESRYGVERFDF